MSLEETLPSSVKDNAEEEIKEEDLKSWETLEENCVRGRHYKTFYINQVEVAKFVLDVYGILPWEAANFLL